MDLIPDTGPSGVGRANGAGLEGILDTEWSGAIAKGADIWFPLRLPGITAAGSKGDVIAAAYYTIEESIDRDHELQLRQRMRARLHPGRRRRARDVFGTAANLLGITFLVVLGRQRGHRARRLRGHLRAWSTSWARRRTSRALNGLWSAGPSSRPATITYNGSGFATGYSLPLEKRSGTRRAARQERSPGSVAASGIDLSPASPTRAGLATCVSGGDAPRRR